MNYIIFDLEWNQPGGGERSERLTHGEIIQIGFIVTDEKLSVIHRDELMIKPVVYKAMNTYVSILTGITQKDIDAGLSFCAAWDAMALFITADTALITWGDDDIPILRENMRFHGMEDVTLPPHYNLQRIFAAQTGSPARQTGLKTAANLLGITDEVKAHDALNDAYMTYLIASKLDIAKGIAEYSSHTADTSSASPPWETEKPVFTAKSAFDRNPSGMVSECRKLHFCCPKCGKDFFATEPIRQGKNSLVAVGECTDYGRLFFRYTLKDGYIRISAFEMNDELEQIYGARLRSRDRREKRKEMYKQLSRNAKRREKKRESEPKTDD